MGGAVTWQLLPLERGILQFAAVPTLPSHHLPALLYSSVLSSFEPLLVFECETP